MSLVTTHDMLSAAAGNHVAVGAFNVIHIETAEGIAKAAEDQGLPVILQISENCVKFHGGLKPIGQASLAIAEAANVPVAVHLDHAEDTDLITEALGLGFTSIMFDGSKLDWENNVAVTRRVVEEARALGVGVEAELGEVGGKDGVHAPGVRTDPMDAKAFVEATGVDSLAVAVGSSHAMTERNAELDLDLIARIKAEVSVPLVLHGSSGVSDENIVAAINAGMSKINISTHLNKVFTEEIRKFLAENPTLVDSRKYLGAGRQALRLETARMLGLFAGKRA